MGCAASPSSVTAPRDHPASGGLSNNGHLRQSDAAPISWRTGSAQPENRAAEQRSVGRSRPERRVIRQRRVVVDDGHDVDRPTAIDRVVHEMRLVAEPEVRPGVPSVSGRSVARDQAAPCGTTGRDGIVRRSAGQVTPDAGPDAVGPDQTSEALAG